jgi:hypothetical protein
VDRFLLQQFDDGPIDLSAIKPASARRFVADQSAPYSSLGGVATLISAFQVYFRFRTACGDHMQMLSAVPELLAQAATQLEPLMADTEVDHG